MKSKILVIDDDESIIILLETILTKKGCIVEKALCYKDGLSQSRSEPFDLIYIDVHLGDGNGLELASVLKAENNSAYIVIMTSDSSFETTQSALREGAFDLMAKPFTVDTLILTSLNALRHKSVRDEKENLNTNLKAVFRSVESGILTLDANWKILMVNLRIQHICGFSDLDQGSTFPVKRPYCSMDCRNIIKNVILTKESSKRKQLICKKESAPDQVVDLTVSVLLSENSKFLGIVFVVEDISRLKSLERTLSSRRNFHGMIGQSSLMQPIYSLIEDLSNVETTALITGESGTGKELVAEAIHYSGKRADKPMVKVNCSALTETLLESELFGHVKGAFTGAVVENVGRFQMAEGGTLFLDEIGDISPGMQLRLLRILQEKEYQRVGESKTRKANVRILAATNKNLKENVLNKTFREDLYYRLKVIEIKIPPLRERSLDIPILADHFLAKFQKKFQKKIIGFSGETIELFMNHSWPGNVRELENAIEHAFVVCRAEIIEPSHLPTEIRTLSVVLGSDSLLTIHLAKEKALILKVLEQVGGNREMAAQKLGISRATLFRKLSKHKIRKYADLLSI